jgi:hypothetical protein
MFYKLTLPIDANVSYCPTCLLTNILITNILQNLFQEYGGFDDLLLIRNMEFVCLPQLSFQKSDERI